MQTRLQDFTEGWFTWSPKSHHGGKVPTFETIEIWLIIIVEVCRILILSCKRVCKTILRAGSHGVPSPIHVTKSPHGGKVPTFETIEIWLIIIIVEVCRILILSCKRVCKTLLRAGSHGVPSPKSQHGGQVPTLETIEIWLIIIVEVVGS